VFPLAFAPIAVIPALLVQALAAPLWLLLGVALTFAGTAGTAVLVHGVGWPVLDFSIPIVVHLLVVAIGTDCDILMAHRSKEALDVGLAAREVARRAVANGWPAVMAAGFLLVAAGGTASMAPAPVAVELPPLARRD
jgi:uncharacterized membrane protein YdfJ with MMPL/SSD domain